MRRQNYSGECKDFFVKHHAYLHWESMLNPWIDCLGKKNVFCQKYDRANFDSGSIINDFKRFLIRKMGMDLPETEISPSSSNDSFNNDQVLTCLLRNKHYGGLKKLSNPQRKAFKTYTKTLSDLDSSGLVLTSHVVCQIISDTSETLEYMESEWGIKFDVPNTSEIDYDFSFHSTKKRKQILNELSRHLI